MRLVHRLGFLSLWIQRSHRYWETFFDEVPLHFQQHFDIPLENISRPNSIWNRGNRWLNYRCPCIIIELRTKVTDVAPAASIWHGPKPLWNFDDGPFVGKKSSETSGTERTGTKFDCQGGRQTSRSQVATWSNVPWRTMTLAHWGRVEQEQMASRFADFLRRKLDQLWGPWVAYGLQFREAKWYLIWDAILDTLVWRKTASYRDAQFRKAKWHLIWHAVKRNTYVSRKTWSNMGMLSFVCNCHHFCTKKPPGLLKSHAQTQIWRPRSRVAIHWPKGLTHTQTSLLSLAFGLEIPLLEHPFWL